MTNCLCGRSEDADSIAAVGPAVISLRKGDWEDLFDNSKVRFTFSTQHIRNIEADFPP
jgi:hypothetical protein